jgi:anaerobic selenocysteine-containing dehydrogenase
MEIPWGLDKTVVPLLPQDRGAMTTHRTFCRFCHAICGIEVDVEDGRAVAVRGDAAHPVSQGYLCEKGKALIEQHEAPERLRGTQKRLADGTFASIPSAQAMDEIAARLTGIIDRDGPAAIAVYSGTHGLFSAAKPLVIAWTRAIGTHWYFTPNTIDQPSISTAWARHGTWDAGVHRFADANVLLFAGNNPGVSAFSREGGPPYANAFRHLRDAKRRGVRIIAIDPRRTELARIADVHLQVTPGEDPTLLAGMVRVILEEGLHDREFVARHVTGMETLRAAVADFSPEYVEARAGVPAGQMIAAARLFAAGPRGTAMTCTGVNMAPRPDVTCHLVTALNSLCGRFNRAGDVVHNPGVLLPPRVRHADVEPPRTLWGRGPRSRFRGLGQFMGEMPINVFADEILTPGPGQVKALVCVGGNPAVAFPNQRRVVEALRALELCAVLDVKMTATAALAHYAVGCKLSLEKPGTSRTAEIQLDVPFAQYTPALVRPSFDVVEEWEFVWGLAHRMRTPLVLDNGQTIDIDRKPTSDEYLDRTHAGSRIPLACVRRHPEGQIFAPAVPERVQPGRPERAAARMDVAPAAVVEQLDAIRRETADTHAAGFTHRLVSRRMMNVYNSTGDHLSRLRRRWPYNPAFMHPDDLARLGARPGDVVRIESAHDFIYAVVEATTDVKPGVVSVAHAHGDVPERDAAVRRIGGNTGRLVSTSHDFEPVSGMARQSAIPVRIRALDAAERDSLDDAADGARS